MKKDGYMYQCTVDPDGRLHNGVWAKETGVPHPLPPGVVVFEKFPSNQNGGQDYLWDGKTLTYSPAPQPDSTLSAESAVQIEDDGTEVTYT